MYGTVIYTVYYNICLPFHTIYKVSTTEVSGQPVLSVSARHLVYRNRIFKNAFVGLVKVFTGFAPTKECST